jgi:hypothetical protein
VKTLFAIITIFLLSFQLMLKTAALFWYESNKEMIAAEMCENRDKPEMNCNGKCVLAKKIAAAEQRDQSFPHPSKIESKIAPCVIEERSVNTQPDWVLARKGFNTIHDNLKPKSLAKGVFHPPQMV